MKLNLSYITQKNEESDINSNEKSILDCINNCTNSEYEEILKKYPDIEKIYALSDYRRNIVNWYDFNPKCSILEIGANFGEITGELCDKLDKVVAIEPSIDKAKAIAKRYEDKLNLEIIVGDVDSITLDEKFDYILLYRLELLPFLKKFTKKTTIILLATDNRFGITYFAGSKYEELNLYESILSNDTIIFSKYEIENKLKELGLLNYKFYYPFPNYKIPNVIFSDEYIPSETSTKLMYNVLYTKGSVVTFDELRALKQITKNKQLPFFSNSYLIEIGASNDTNLSKVKFVSYNNNRKKQYQLLTKIYSNIVIKNNINECSKNHLINIDKNTKELKKLNFNIADYLDSNKIISPYISGDTLDKIIVKKILNKQFEDVYKIIDLWYKEIKLKLQNSERYRLNENILLDDKENYENLIILKNCYIDLVFENTFINDEKFVFFDQEWCFTGIPLEFIIYRAIRNLYSYNIEIQSVISKEEMFYRYNITQYIKLFDKIEKYIQSQIVDSTMQYINKNSLENLYDTNYVSVLKGKLEDYELNNIRQNEYIKLLESDNKKKQDYIKTLELEKITNNNIKFGKLFPLNSKRRNFVKKIFRNKVEKLHSEKYIYEKWIKKNEPNPIEISKQKEEKIFFKPKISIVVPLYNTPKKFLKELIDCMFEQTYSNWELCLADGSPKPLEFAKKFFKGDSRIKYTVISENKGISGNTNEALKLATGDYIGLLDHDDLLPKFSLYEVAKAINDNPYVEFIYTDEDKFENSLSNRFGVFFKPDFSPYTLNSANYICHFSIFKKDLLEKIGGFRSEYDGSQDYDIVCRAVENTKNIIHIPKVLYHWRSHINSTAQNADSKPYAYEIGKKVIKDHIMRSLNTEVEVTDGLSPGSYDITYKVKGNPKVSIIIDGLNTSVDDIKKIIQKIKISKYSNLELVLITDFKSQNFDVDKIILGDKNIICSYNKAINNSTGDYFIIFDNELLEIDDELFIENLLGICQDPSVGIVGTKLYNSQNLVEHCGIVLGMNGVGDFIYKGVSKDIGTYMQRLEIIHNLSCVYIKYAMIDRNVYNAINGFTEDFEGLLTSIDTCLKILDIEKQVVINPMVSFCIEELSIIGENYKNDEEFIKKWEKYYDKGDIFFSPNLSKKNTGLSIKFD